MTRRTLPWLLGCALLAAGAQTVVGGWAPRSTTPPELGAAEAAALASLGGFRAIASSALWLELIEQDRTGDAEGLLATAQLITRLDPRFESAWTATGWSLAVNLPSLEPRPERRWPYVRQGIEHLRAGLARNPKSALIRADLATILLFKVEGEPTLRERYLRDLALNPLGRTPLEDAGSLWEEALAQPGHPPRIDWGVLRTTWRLAEAALHAGDIERARALLAKAEGVLTHVEAVHEDLPEDAVAPHRLRLQELRARVTR